VVKVYQKTEGEDVIVIEVLAAGILPILTVVVLAEAVGRIFEWRDSRRLNRNRR